MEKYIRKIRKVN